MENAGVAPGDKIVIRKEALSSPLIALRSLGYNQHVKGEDEFDGISTFIVARVGSEAVGQIRITPSLHGPLKEWFLGESPVSLGSDCVDLTRAVVIPWLRGTGVFQMLMIYALQTALEEGHKRARAGVALEAKHYERVRELGFERAGGPLFYDDHQLQPSQGYMIVCHFAESSHLWKPLDDSIRQGFNQKFSAHSQF